MAREYSFTLTLKQYNFLLPVYGIAAHGTTRLLAKASGHYFIGTHEDFAYCMRRCLYL